MNASVQTDPVRTKLMRDASTEEQKDLIPMMDEEILTDGNLVLRNAGNREFLQFMISRLGLALITFCFSYSDAFCGTDDGYYTHTGHWYTNSDAA